MSPLFARSASPLFHRPESSTLLDGTVNETAAFSDEATPESSSQPLMSDEQSTRSDYNSEADAPTSKQFTFWKNMQKINAKFPKLNREVKQKHEEKQLEEVASVEDDQKNDQPLLISNSVDQQDDVVEEDGIEAPSLDESTGSSSSSTASRSGSSASSTSSAASTPSSSESAASVHSDEEEEEEEEDDCDESGISLGISDYGNTSYNDDDISLAAESVDTTSLLSRKSGASDASHPSRAMAAVPKVLTGNSSVKSPSSSTLNLNKVKRYPVRLGKYETIVEEVGVADETAQEVRPRTSKSGSMNRKTRYA